MYSTPPNAFLAQATTLGFSADHWPPTQFDTEQWRTNRLKFAVCRVKGFHTSAHCSTSRS
jgi:hypothetical protein